MTVVGLGQHGSEAVGPGFASLSCQILLRFRIVTLPTSAPFIHKIFRYQKFSETEGFPYEISRYCERKNLTENRDIPLLCIKFFDTRN